MRKCEFKFFRLKRIGPGGWRCNCCAPPPGAKRVRLMREAKRRERQVAKLEIEQELLQAV